MTNLAAGHRDRLRKRYLEQGAQGLADYEMLELMLMQSIPRRDVKPLAKQLIQKFGSFAKVLDADIKDLKATEGVGESTAFALKLASGVNETYHKTRAKQRQCLEGHLEAIDYLYAKLEALTHEEFHAIYLDSKNYIITDEALFRGSVSSSAVYPREILKQALKHGAASVILAHNHPSGDPTPSYDDDFVTMEVVTAAKAINLRVLDHVIIGKGKHFSYAMEGKL